MGKTCCRFRLDLRVGLVYAQVLGWKRGARNVIKLGIQLKEMEIDRDPTQGKRKGEETSNPMVNTKSAKRKQSHQPPTSKKNLTSNVQHALRSQCRELISFRIGPSTVVFQRHYGSAPSSFLVRQQGLLIADWLLTTLTSVCCKKRKMGGPGKLDLR